jgi:hypothetical protein
MSDYLTIEEAKAGIVVVTDGGFTCMKEGEEKTVHVDHEGYLYVECDEGSHYLNGQLEDGEYVGLRMKEHQQ